jgi:hypothetical protein
LQSKGEFNSDDSPKLDFHNPRRAYIDNLYEELKNALIPIASQEKGNLLVVIGECTLEIHVEVLNLVLGNVSLDSVNIYGAKTQAPDYDLKVVNASKSEYKNGKRVNGLGVHALMGYLFLNTKNKNTGVALEPSILTLNDDTRQNLITINYGGKLHAITHLLNGNENGLANELKNCGYVSVGGDLNNITVGTDLVQTCNREGTQMSMGSNSTSSTLYDKIVIL